jgi:hypothetical protein
MTLLNFETYFRPAKVEKAIEMYNKGQVIELRKAKIVWIGKMKIGLYKVQINLDGINIGSATCPCDSRSRSRYCEHKLAVLFALRKKLDLYPALTGSSQKILPANTELREQLAIINEIDKKILDNDLLLLASTTNRILKAAIDNMLNGDIRTAIGDCIEVIKQTSIMIFIPDYYNQYGDEFIRRSFQLLENAIEATRDEQLLEHLAYDLRVEVLRNFRSNYGLFHQYLSLLQSVSGQGTSNEKYNKVLNALSRFDKEFPNTRRY